MDLYNELQEKRDEVQLNRKKVLAELVKRYGSVRATAMAISCTTAQLYALLNGRRNMGDKLARSFEEKLNLEPGTFDSKLKLSESIEPERKMAKVTKIPLLSTVQAGKPTDPGDLISDEYVEVLGDLPDGCFGLCVNGDSMKPLIDDGDIVVVDPSRYPRHGDYFVARSELENFAEATVKKYQITGFDDTGREVFDALPLNNEYPTMNSVKHRLTVIGTVCKLIKDM